MYCQPCIFTLGFRDPPQSTNCEQFRQRGVSLTVESENSQTILGEYSPRLQLIAFDVDHDVGLFKLQDRYPDQRDFVNIDWLMERDDAYFNDLPVGAKVACCGFSEVQEQAAFVSCFETKDRTNRR